MCPFGEWGCTANVDDCDNCDWGNVVVGFFFFLM